jgi:hypothetical protein
LLEALLKKVNSDTFNVVMLDVEENDIPVFDVKQVPLIKLYTIR